MRRLQLAVIIATISALVAAPALASRDEPIRNPADIPISWNAPGQPTLERIQRAIIAGCAKRGWQCREARPGEIRAVLYVRSHMAESLITFNTQTFAITYVNSSELRYDSARNTIHRKYNLWVANLISDINAAIAAVQ